MVTILRHYATKKENELNDRVPVDDTLQFGETLLPLNMISIGFPVQQDEIFDSAFLLHYISHSDAKKMTVYIVWL